jgi:hypothetical protein
MKAVRIARDPCPGCEKNFDMTSARRSESDPPGRLRGGCPKRASGFGSLGSAGVDQVHVIVTKCWWRPIAAEVANQLGISRLTVQKYLRDGVRAAGDAAPHQTGVDDRS